MPAASLISDESRSHRTRPLALLPCSLLLVPLGVAGWLYFGLAAALGLGFVAYALRGFRAQDPNRWARSFFLYTLAYITFLFAAILLDAGPGGVA